MQRFVLAAFAASVVGLMATTVPAQAQYGLGYHHDLGCIDAGNCGNHRYVNRWNDGDWDGPRRYYNRYPSYGYGYDYGWNPGLGVAAGIAGVTAGAVIANSRGHYTNSYVSADDAHTARCEARYRSYDPSTNQFLGYDGQYHECRL